MSTETNHYVVEDITPSRATVVRACNEDDAASWRHVYTLAEGVDAPEVGERVWIDRDAQTITGRA